MSKRFDRIVRIKKCGIGIPACGFLWKFAVAALSVRRFYTSDNDVFDAEAEVRSRRDISGESLSVAYAGFHRF